MTVAIKIRYTRKAIAGRKSRPERGADASVVAEIPYQCLLRNRIVEDPIGLPVLVKVACRDEFPTADNRRPGRGADESVLIEIPYHRLQRTRVEQEVICMTVAIKIRHPHHAIAGRKSRPRRGTDENVVF